MIDVSVSQLVNQVDNSHFTLYTEWQDTHFKVILLRSSMVPLSGEMHTENANYFLDHLGESLDTYFKRTRHAFSGENVEIQFFLQDDTFIWKQQNILTRGEITVHPLSNILIISDTLKQMLEHYQQCHERIVILEKENEYLNKNNKKLIADIEEMINIKNTMEKDLYKKFLILLNSKKKKIRELLESIDKNEQATESVYDKTTDESEGSDTETKKTQNNNTKKRKVDHKDEQKDIVKNRKDFRKQENSTSSESESPKPSTSKYKLITQDTPKHHIMKSKEILNTSEEESEEDLFAQ